MLVLGRDRKSLDSLRNKIVLSCFIFCEIWLSEPEWGPRVPKMKTFKKDHAYISLIGCGALDLAGLETEGSQHKELRWQKYRCLL